MTTAQTRIVALARPFVGPMRPEEIPDRRQLLTLLGFFATALTLLFVARGGASESWFALTLAVYVVAAALWIGVQYLDSRDGQLWVIPLRATALVVVTGVASVVLYLAIGWSTAALLALYLFWFAGSAGVTRLRNLNTDRGDGVFRSASTRTAVGVVLTAGGLLAMLIGIGLLARGTGLPTKVGIGLIGIAVLVLLAIGLNLLSASAIRGVQQSPTVLIIILGVAGFVVLLAATAAATTLSRTPAVAVVFVVLLLLMVATASRTHADVVILMAVVATLGMTPNQQPMNDKMTRSGTGAELATLVALGDSYMSGEGAEVYFTGTDEGGGNQCRQAPTAWAAMMAQEQQFEAFAFLACSGAVTGNVLYDPH